MRNKIAILSGVLVLMLAASAFAGVTYEADVSHSNVDFSVRHMLVSNVSGRFKDFSATIVYDEQDITKSSVQATIKVESINTDNERRDGHLKSPDFFDAANHPEITFVSKKVMKKGDGYVALGDFTMRGVTKEIELPFQILGKIKDQSGKHRIGIEASLTLNRMDYEVKWDRKLDNGGLVVSEEVKVNLSIEAIEK